MKNKLRLLLCVVVMMVCMCGDVFAVDLVINNCTFSDFTPEVLQNSLIRIPAGKVLTLNPYYGNEVSSFVSSSDVYVCLAFDPAFSSSYYGVYVFAPELFLLNLTYKNGSSSVLSSSLYNGYYLTSVSSYKNDSFIFDYPFTVFSFSSYDMHRLLDNVAPDFDKVNTGGSGGSSQIVKYNSDIPAPQNLTFSYSNEGGWNPLWIPLHIGGSAYHSLNWTNTLVDSYGVRISAVVNAVFDDGLNQVSSERMVCSDGSDGSSAGYRASNGNFKYDFGSLMSSLQEEYHDRNLDGISCTQYRVQFYQYVDGVLEVGPVSVVHLNKNMFGVYSGTTVTTEFPLDLDNVGSSGGLLASDSSDSWSSSGQQFTDYDTKGDIAGSGTVGDDSSYVNGTSHNAFTSVTDLLNSLVNLPNIISYLFNSLQSLMSGIAGFPAVLGSLFSFLPTELISILALGFSIIIVLRILGR